MPRRSGSAQSKTAEPSPDSSWLPHETQQHDAGEQQGDTQGFEKGVGRPGSWSAKDFVHLPTGRQLRRHRNGARSAARVYHHFLDRNQRGKACDQPITNGIDRKSTRLNSSHLGISYAVFCLKKKKKTKNIKTT